MLESLVETPSAPAPHGGLASVVGTLCCYLSTAGTIVVLLDIPPLIPPHLLANLCSCNTPLPLDALQGYLSTIALPTDYAMQFVLTTGTTVAAAWQNLIHLTVRPDTPTPSPSFPLPLPFCFGLAAWPAVYDACTIVSNANSRVRQDEHRPPLPIAI
jgi:hypothetical protein